MGADRRTIKAQQRAKLTTGPYDAGYLAHKHSISLEQARELIRDRQRSRKAEHCLCEVVLEIEEAAN
jgi:hypothetical protein